MFQNFVIFENFVIEKFYLTWLLLIPNCRVFSFQVCLVVFEIYGRVPDCWFQIFWIVCLPSSHWLLNTRFIISDFWPLFTQPTEAAFSFVINIPFFFLFFLLRLARKNASFNIFYFSHSEYYFPIINYRCQLASI